MRSIAVNFCLALTLLLGYIYGDAQPIMPELELSDETLLASYARMVDSVKRTLSYRHDTLALAGGIGTVIIPKGFKCLVDKQAQRVLFDLWSTRITKA